LRVLVLPCSGRRVVEAGKRIGLELRGRVAVLVRTGFVELLRSKCLS